MKIHNRLTLLLLTAGLAACGSDLGGSKGEPLSSTGAVIIPVTAPTTANKASVGFRVVFPEQAGAAKATLSSAMTKVTIATSGECGVASLELTPAANTGVMDLQTGECTFVATATDSTNAAIESAKTSGSLLGGANNISLTFLGGPWLFVDPATNEKLSLNLVGGGTLTGLRINPNNGALQTRWFGPDTGGDGPTADDLMGGTTLTNPAQLHVTGTFSGGTSTGANLVRFTSGMTNLTNWEGTYAAGQRVIKILGVNPNTTYPTFDPTTYRDYFTSKVIDGTTIEGNIAEFTVDSHTLGTPYGTCTAATPASARTAALTAALDSVRKSAAQTLTGTVTVNWIECVSSQNVDVTDIYSSVTIHPFRAKSSFSDPASALQVELNKAIADYKLALTSEDPIKGMDLVQLRKAASEFVATADLAGDNLSNTADTAHFFGAISRLASLGLDTASDGAANGLNDFNDVLDALGAPTNALSRSWSNLITFPESCVGPYLDDCHFNFPTTSPTSGQLLTLLDSKVNTQLDLAIADLTKISAGFTYNFVDTSGATTNFDYGDALALTAVAHGIKAELAIDMAYNLNLDIDATVNGTGPASVQAFMTANPNLGKLDATRYVTELAQAKTDLETGLNKMNDAIDAIEAEGTGISQENEFIYFYKTDSQCIPDPLVTTWPYCTLIEVDRSAEEIANFRDGISKMLAGLKGPITVGDNMTPTNTADDTILDPSKFFAGINFRALLPTFTGDVPSSLFPDATMGGVLVQTPNMNINQDVDGNGKPDMLENPNFYSALVSGKTFSLDLWWSTPTSQYDGIYAQGLVLNSDKTFSVAWNRNIQVYPYGTETGTATGSWQILADGTLLLTFTSSAPANIASVIFKLEYYPDAMMQGLDTRADITFTNNSTVRTWSWWMVPQVPY